MTDIAALKITDSDIMQTSVTIDLQDIVNDNIETSDDITNILAHVDHDVVIEYVVDTVEEQIDLDLLYKAFAERMQDGNLSRLINRLAKEAKERGIPIYQDSTPLEHQLEGTIDSLAGYRDSEALSFTERLEVHDKIKSLQAAKATARAIATHGF